jgi:hypothetical protein
MQDEIRLVAARFIREQQPAAVTPGLLIPRSQVRSLPGPSEQPANWQIWKLRFAARRGVRVRNRNDVGMVKARSDLRLPQESPPKTLISRQVSREQLEGDPDVRA